MTDSTSTTTLPTGTALDRRHEAFRIALREQLAEFAGYAADLADTDGAPGGRNPLRGVVVPIRPLGLTLDQFGSGPGEDGWSSTGADGAGPARSSRSDRATPVVPVHFYGDLVMVGPAHDPDGAVRPCGTCLRRRWATLRPERERQALETAGAYHAAGPGSPVPVEWGVLSVITALCELAEAWHRRLGSEVPGQIADVLEINVGSGAVARFPLLAHRSCPDCARRNDDAPPAAHGFPQSRSLPRPGATRLRHWSAYGLPTDALANRLCGALATGVNGNRVSVGINAPVIGSLRLGGRQTERSTLYEITWGGHAGTYRESRTLGLLEGLERYAGQRPRDRRPFVRAALADLGEATDPAAGLPALDPRDTVLYPDGFYRQKHGRSLVPFRSDLVIDWVWGHSFARGGPLLVPSQLAFYGPQHRREQFVAGSSSGCATGGALEEAALHGLLELIERDAFMVAWYSAATLPEIDPASCTDPQTAAVIDRMHALGYHVRLFDLRLDLPIPIVLCVAARRTPGPGNLCMSAGIGFDPEGAALTAAREVASYLPGFAERVLRNEDELRALVGDYGALTELEQHAMLYGLPEMADRSPFPGPRTGTRTLTDTFADWSPPQHTDLAQQLRACVELVREVGKDVVVVEQTCPEQAEVGVHTAAVIVPGLVPIDFGWSLQRAPHTERVRSAAWRAGKRAEPLREQDVHRHPHPFL